MSQAITAAIYFLISRELHQAPIFPGNELIYNALDDSSSAASLADLTLHVTTTTRAANEDFIHTNGDVYMWRYFWPFLASHFGIEVNTFTIPSPKHSKLSEKIQKLT